MTINAAATRKMAVAVGQVMPGGVAANNAAPGVDQASTTGMRVFNESAMPPTAKPRHSAVTAEPVCSTEAPSARIAWTTRAMVPPNPTTVAMRAEDQECGGGRCLIMPPIVYRGRAPNPLRHCRPRRAWRGRARRAVHEPGSVVWSLPGSRGG